MLRLNYILIFTLATLYGCGGGGGSSGPTFNLSPSQVKLTMTMQDLPANLTYNKSTTPDNIQEFGWSVTFDMNGDGAINTGDIILGLLHFKAPGAIEKSGPISDLNSYLAIYTSDSTAQAITSAIVNKQILNDSIILSINKSATPELQNISSSTLVYFETNRYDSLNSKSSFDYYPSIRNYVNIPFNKQFTDAESDVSFPEIDMVAMELSF